MNDPGWELLQVRRLTRRIRELLEHPDNVIFDWDGEVFLLGDPPSFERFRAAVIGILGVTYELKRARLGCPDKLDLIRKTCLFQLGPPVEVERLGGMQALRISDLMKLREIADELVRVAEARSSLEVRDSVKAAEETIDQCGRRLKDAIDRMRFALEVLAGKDLSTLPQSELMKQAITHLSASHDISMVDRLRSSGLVELSELLLKEYREKVLGVAAKPFEQSAAIQNAKPKKRGRWGKAGSQSQPDSACFLDSLLVQHHGYGYPNRELSLEPIKQTELVKLSGYGKATVSDYFKRKFDSYKDYTVRCRDRIKLEAHLRALNDEGRAKKSLRFNDQQYVADDE